jgi:hypothetical protein
MWIFVLEQNGKASRLGISRAFATVITDALGALIQQTGEGGMTVLAEIGPVKGMFGRDKGNDIVAAYRFTRGASRAVGVASAELALPIWSRFAPDDEVLRSAAAVAGDSSDRQELLDSSTVVLECIQAADRAGDEAASYAAQAVRSALLSAAGHTDVIALRAAAYAGAYSIQAAHKVDTRKGEDLTRTLDAFILDMLPAMSRVPF